MEILVKPKEDKNENKSIIDSKDIICPKCGDICLLDIKGYKISLYGCKSEDNIDNILLEEYEKIQKVEQPKILCGNCNKSNIIFGKTNEFFKCLKCDQNLCQECKLMHDNRHNIIFYEQTKSICNIHNKGFNSYCEKCKINLCDSCKSKHEDKHNIINYGEIILDEKKFKSQTQDLNIKIFEFNEKIKGIIKILNKISNNMKIYYKINKNLYDIYERKNRTYQLLKNINEIIIKNDLILKDINKIINENETINLFKNLLELYNNMNNKNNNIFDNNKESPKNEIIAIYEKDNKNKETKIFGKEFIENNKNNFDLYINGNSVYLSDKLDNSFWNEKKKTIEIKLVEKNKCINMKNMFHNCETLISISQE